MVYSWVTQCSKYEFTLISYQSLFDKQFHNQTTIELNSFELKTTKI